LKFQAISRTSQFQLFEAVIYLMFKAVVISTSYLRLAVNESMQKYLCSLGSNIEPQSHFPKARAALEALSGNISFSRNIPTRPVNMNTKRDFLNALFIIQTSMSAEQLKQEFNRIEEALGRDRSDPQRSLKDRTIDIDILGKVSDNPKVPDYLTSLLTDLGIAS
tara:strand:+ start:187 stop:678 length:492 start_codon:yes stop_codon:yes gene_type:complete